MSEALEGKRATYDNNSRVLYCPEGISWEAQTVYGHKLIKSGHRVELHDHKMLAPCGVAGRCGELTDGGDHAILVTSTADSTTTEPQNDN